MEYDKLREQYKPKYIKVLLIAESPPPAATEQSSRQFYRSEKIRKDDRLFTNTVRALFPDVANATEPELETQKEQLLHRFQQNGFYMIEALPNSLHHHITKSQRQALIAQHLPELLQRVKKLAKKNTKIILIKSNVFEVAAEPLRQAGLNVLNKELVDYPGHYNQRDYRQKLAALLDISYTQPRTP